MAPQRHVVYECSTRAQSKQHPLLFSLHPCGLSTWPALLSPPPTSLVPLHALSFHLPCPLDPSSCPTPFWLLHMSHCFGSSNGPVPLTLPPALGLPPNLSHSTPHVTATHILHDSHCKLLVRDAVFLVTRVWVHHPCEVLVHLL